MGVPQDCLKLVPAFERYAKERTGQEGKLGYAEKNDADTLRGAACNLNHGKTRGGLGGLRGARSAVGVGAYNFSRN